MKILEEHCLADLPPHFRAATNKIRCFAHILNLAAQATISVLHIDPCKAPEHNALVRGDLADGSDLPAEVLKSLPLYDRVSLIFFH